MMASYQIESAANKYDKFTWQKTPFETVMIQEFNLCCPGIVRFDLATKNHHGLTINLPQPKISQIVCGERHSLVTGENGDIYGFGDNSSGQIDESSTRGEYVISKPKVIEQIHKFRN